MFNKHISSGFSPKDPVVMANNTSLTYSHLDLHRFTGAQCGIYKMILGELSRGKKQYHWMWFIFPQIDGFWDSEASSYYSLKDLEEAYQYLAHPILGTRLIECTKTILAVEGRSAADIFRYPDNLRFHSSMTLFAYFSGFDSIFISALIKYFNGAKDETTLQLLINDRSRSH